MVWDEAVTQLILDPATHKALATSGPHGLNVVPVSAIRIVDEYIYLFDFFMNKTRENVQQQPEVSLTAWRGLDGYQIKAECSYEDSGPHFDHAKSWCTQQFPTRSLHAVLVLTPKEVCSVGIADKV